MLKKLPPFLTFISMLLFTGCLITATASVPRPVVRATVRVISPPAVVVVEDPDLIVIPGTYVYWLDGQDDVYFYGGIWWRSWDGYWYRADGYAGPWVRIDLGYVPYPVMHLPYNWRQKYYNAPRVRWTEAHHNWKSWENKKHWEQNKWKK
jgi:hypothetical protein